GRRMDPGGWRGHRPRAGRGGLARGVGDAGPPLTPRAPPAAAPRPRPPGSSHPAGSAARAGLERGSQDSRAPADTTPVYPALFRARGATGPTRDPREDGVGGSECRFRAASPAAVATG